MFLIFSPQSYNSFQHIKYFGETFFNVIEHIPAGFHYYEYQQRSMSCFTAIPA